MQDLLDSSRNRNHHDVPSVGIIGLGLLGGALARRLLAAGYQVWGFDLDAARMQLFEQAGGHRQSDPRDVFSAASATIFSLPTSALVNELVETNLAGLARGHILLDTTTGDPHEMMGVADRLRSRGVDYVEANVAGSSAAVEAGDAVLLIGGEARVVTQVEPVLNAIASRRFHLGAVGSGSRFKLIHNLLLGLHRAVLAEGIVFAEALGFDTATTLEILAETPAQSAVMASKGAKMVAHDYTPQARLTQHLKDVRLIMAQAKRVGTATPLSEVHERLLCETEQLGHGESDNSAIVEWYRSQIHPGDIAP